jgi:fatty acid synthase
MCEWMVTRGARKLVITSRSGVRTGYQKWKLSQMKKQRADVTVSKLDVSDASQAKQLLDDHATSRIGGIFHLVAVS